jgi:protein-disulfide isomerase
VISTDERGTVTVGEAGASVVVDIFEDLMCPYCRQLESRHGEALEELIGEGRITVRYHVLDFLNRLSATGDYSTRAATALRDVAASGDEDSFIRYQHLLLSRDFQPRENAETDHTNAQLGAAALAAGASEDVARTITAGTTDTDPARFGILAVEDMDSAGGSGTPTVLVDGEQVDALGDSTWVERLAK